MQKKNTEKKNNAQKNTQRFTWFSTTTPMSTDEKQ